MFVEARTRPVLAEVCRLLGYPDSNAILLRHHTNAVYAVGDVVVKIAPGDQDLEQVHAMVAVVDWLVAQDFPTVRLHPGLSQPVLAGGHAVTVWQRLDPAHDNPITVSELGTLLRDLHALPAPPVPLPVLRPIHSIERSVARSEILNDKEQDLLMGRLETLATGWETMRFPRGASLIQSDPQVRNALRRFDGRPVLSDWDGAALGPREWDIATIAVHCRRFDPPGPGAFADFTAAYGWDATSWPQFEELCQLRELQMIATNARKSRPGTEAADEVHHRIAGLVDDGADLRRWHIL
ncbi:phosphotransferase [Micromonospora maris]|uniref:Aminoglycoside phosphotransferase n=1 Tax=Micromonospora maris TaxID=1003110 RepID=A0A9X0LBC5_9ACTN|nr:phosphotransferase [Micromonospora maris]AEB44274.1 aminoglycoside phosphotransferase [Micromonospora maris AB-18-032]KUJ43823.1 aminoglycoside phosphotransferase [Micromonospora maris]